MNEDLDEREQRFVDEYLVDLKMNRAALRCGASFASCREIGSQIYARPKVRVAINAAIAERSLRTGIEADRVLRELSYIAFSDIREVRFNDDGTYECTTETGRSIQEIHVTRTTTTDDDGNVSVTIKGKVKLLDKRQALVTLMQHLGMLVADLPGLEVLLNRMQPNMAMIVRRLIANPSLMPIAHAQPNLMPCFPESNDVT